MSLPIHEFTYEELLEQRRNSQPSTLTVQPEILEQRLREHLATQPDGPAKEIRLRTVLLSCKDGLYTVQFDAQVGSLVTYIQAFGDTEEEVIHNYLSMPVIVSAAIPMVAFPEVVKNKLELSEHRRRLFGIFETMYIENKYIMNMISDDPQSNVDLHVVNNFMELMSIYVSNSSPERKLAQKVNIYASVVSRIPPGRWEVKPRFLTKLHNHYENVDFLHALAMLTHNENGAPISQATLNIIETWCPGISAALVPFCMSDLIHTNLIRRALCAMATEGIQKITDLEEPLKQLVAAKVVEQIKKCLPSNVQLLLAREEMTKEEYLEARGNEEPEEAASGSGVHEREYAAIMQEKEGAAN